MTRAARAARSRSWSRSRIRNGSGSRSRSRSRSKAGCGGSFSSIDLCLRTDGSGIDFPGEVLQRL